MKRILLLFMLIVTTAFSVVGCGKAKKIAALEVDFEEAMEDKDYEEAKDILDEMKELDDENEDYRECRRTYKRAIEEEIKEAERKIQFCDVLRTALITSVMDPDVVTSYDYDDDNLKNDVEISVFLDNAGCTCTSNVFDILGFDSVDEIYETMDTSGKIKVIYDEGIIGLITVYVDEGEDITISSGPHKF